MSDPIGILREIKVSVDALASGVGLLTEAINSQNELLRKQSVTLAKLHEAATKEPNGSPLHDALTMIVLTLDVITGQLNALPNAVAERVHEPA